MNLLTTYEHMLNLGGLIVSPDGLVSVALSDKNMPALISVKEDNGYVEKRLVLPTKDQLSLEGGWDRRMAFHPLKENLFSGESKVVEYLRKAINFRFNQVISELIDQSIVYATSTDQHKKLTKDQIDLLETIKEADQTMLNNFRKILKQVKPTNTKHSFVSIYLKKLGKIDDVSYACVGSVSFPFYNELIQSEKEFHGVKLRKNDFACFKRILEYIIPNIKEKDAYNVGISESIAPFAECLIRLTNKLGNDVNRLTTLLYKKSTHIPKEERESIFNLLYFNDEHISTFDNLDSLLPEIRVIPQLPGNEPKESKSSSNQIQNTGETVIPEQRNTWETLNNQSVPTQEPTYSQPIQTPQPVSQTSHMTHTQQLPTGSTTVSELPPLRESRLMSPYMQQQQYMQFPPQQPVAFQQYNQGLPVAPPPGYNAYMQQQQGYVSPFTPKNMMTPGPQMPMYQPNPGFNGYNPQMGYNTYPQQVMGVPNTPPNANGLRRTF